MKRVSENDIEDFVLLKPFKKAFGIKPSFWHHALQIENHWTLSESRNLFIPIPYFLNLLDNYLESIKFLLENRYPQAP